MAEHDPNPLGLFDEYKLFFESAERVTDRRINLNRSNYTICIAIVTGMALGLNWALSATDPATFVYVCGAICFISLASILLCLGWTQQITDLKTLNHAKFDVLNSMASDLEFCDDGGNKIHSYEPFRKEWEIVESLNGTTSFLSFKVLKGSTVEFTLPWSFLILFVFTFLLSAWAAGTATLSHLNG